ncbi:hypothetical protein ACRN9A_18440 [Shewanella frigidimarina]|uniref:hypothetical protein n=1 Tax=Shewanella frigidimarina TaxID=56812 RepID=UPI003D79BE45
MHIIIMEENDSLASETSTFYKWISQSYPDVTVSTPENKARHQLNDQTLLLPLVQLATSPDLINYLKLVLEYMSFKFRGAMKSDSNTIEVRAEITNGPNGESKRFRYKGTADGYSQTVEKFDPNAFFNGD